MSLFFTAAMMIAFATSFGYSAEQSFSNVGMFIAADRKSIDKQIERDDPFCFMIAFPTEFGNLITPLRAENNVNDSRYRTRIRWVGNVVTKRIDLGGIFLFESGWKTLASRVEGLENLE